MESPNTQCLCSTRRKYQPCLRDIYRGTQRCICGGNHTNDKNRKEDVQARPSAIRFDSPDAKWVLVKVTSSMEPLHEPPLPSSQRGNSSPIPTHSCVTGASKSARPRRASSLIILSSTMHHSSSYLSSFLAPTRDPFAPSRPPKRLTALASCIRAIARCVLASLL